MATTQKYLPAEGDVDEKVFDEQFSLFHYDVPTRNGYANPSNRLYPIAVRLTESAWMMRTSDIPYQLMAEMRDNGCSVEVNKFDKSESRRLIHQAVARLQEELAAAVVRAQASHNLAERTLNAATEGENPSTPEEAEKAHLRQAKAIEKRLTLLASQITKAASRFGINEQAVNINRLNATAAMIRDNMQERASAYIAAQVALRNLGTIDGTALARLADDNVAEKVPVYVIVDMLRESGDDENADRLQEAFKEVGNDDEAAA